MKKCLQGGETLVPVSCFLLSEEKHDTAETPGWEEI